LLAEEKCHAYLFSCDERVGYMGVVVTHRDRPSPTICNRLHAPMPHVQGCPCHEKTPFYLLLELNC